MQISHAWTSKSSKFISSENTSTPDAFIGIGAIFFGFFILVSRSSIWIVGVGNEYEISEEEVKFSNGNTYMIGIDTKSRILTFTAFFKSFTIGTF